MTERGAATERSERRLQARRAQCPGRVLPIGARVVAALLLVLALTAPSLAQDPAPPPPGETPRPEADIAQRVKELREGDVAARRKAVFALWNAGPTLKQGLDSVGAALSDPDDYVADVAARILDRLGPASAAAFDGVDAALADRRPFVRRAAARILWKMGPPSKDAVPSLLPMIRDADADVRIAVVDALSQMGRHGAEEPADVVRALAAALDDTDPRVRTKAALGLTAFGEVGEIARDPLIARLEDTDAEVRTNAANALWSMGRSARKALDRLHARLADPSARVRAAALGAVAAIDPRDPRVMPALFAAAKDADPDVRRTAIGFLGGGHADAPGVASAVEAAVADADLRVRSTAAGLLYKLGSAAVPALITALRDGDPDVRVEACKGCREVGPAAARAAPFLVDALRGSPDPMYAALAAEALGRVGGPDAADAVPELRRIMRWHGSPSLRAECALAVWRLDPARADEVIATARSLADDPTWAFYGCRVLGEMGAAAAVAVPDLIRLLDAPGYTPQAAAKALGQIGASAADAVPRLERLAREDTEPRVRAKADEALAAIRAAQAKERR